MTSSDLELLQRTTRGERAAFEEFVERHQDSLYRFAMALAGRREDAEELLQQTFVAAWRAANDLHDGAQARAWLFAIARNAHARSGRRASAREERERSIEELGELAGFGECDVTPERIAQAAEERELFDAALASLAPNEREILVLRELEGWSGDDTARWLGLSLAAQKSRLHRARLALAVELRRRMRDEL